MLSLHKIHDPGLTMKFLTEIQIKEHSVIYLNSLFQIVKVTHKIKTEELSPELQLNALWNTGLDRGVQETTNEETGKVWIKSEL